MASSWGRSRCAPAVRASRDAAPLGGDAGDASVSASCPSASASGLAGAAEGGSANNGPVEAVFSLFLPLASMFLPGAAPAPATAVAAVAAAAVARGCSRAVGAVLPGPQGPRAARTTAGGPAARLPPGRSALHAGHPALHEHARLVHGRARPRQAQRAEAQPGGGAVEAGQGAGPLPEPVERLPAVLPEHAADEALLDPHLLHLPASLPAVQCLGLADLCSDKLPRVLRAWAWGNAQAAVATVSRGLVEHQGRARDVLDVSQVRAPAADDEADVGLLNADPVVLVPRVTHAIHSFGLADPRGNQLLCVLRTWAAADAHEAVAAVFCGLVDVDADARGLLDAPQLAGVPAHEVANE
mmetsp:Transcript_92488/g.293315  ORF Transcript_92488/g.293315 Transcript_92488/m.293315 type:complete len:355 (-) Transcript_92488:394-1458(-)